MSKKNNKSKKKQFYNYDLEREKKEQEAKKQKAEKAKTVSGGVTKVKKTKAVRLRKGVKVRGIKIVDSSSKKKAQRLLQAEQARKALAKMDVEDSPAAAGSKTKAAAASKSAGKKKAAGANKREPKAAGPKPMAVE